MKYTRGFLLLAGFLISACSEPPDPQMAKLQRYYAQKGEGISPAVKKPENPNTRQARMPYLSTTNVPAPLSTTNAPPPLSTTNAPPPLSTTNAPPPLSTTNAPPPLSTTNAPPPLSTTNAPLSPTNAPVPSN
jgi:hypothetical protein